ncbi:hypothetical protein RF11_08732 [Thelohanellus kitauei]|uniref:Uncharacterized protein n=1 Tax=Thelohanellus kitauei TaxID=669202 RepID=A0A0C2MWU3_THEKT|nr:hypothetical protein RF11_08732 [Thelohanellus kitauei]
MNVEKHLVFLVLFLLESRALVTETNLDAKEVFRFEKEIPSLQIDNEIHEIGWVWLINPENVLNIKCQLWQNDNVTDIAEYAHKGDKYVTHLYELGEFVGYFDSNKLVLHKLPPSLEGADLHICVTYTVRSFEFESVCAKYAQLKSTRIV